MCYLTMVCDGEAEVLGRTREDYQGKPWDILSEC